MLEQKWINILFFTLTKYILLFKETCPIHLLVVFNPPCCQYAVTYIYIYKFRHIPDS